MRKIVGVRQEPLGGTSTLWSDGTVSFELPWTLYEITVHRDNRVERWIDGVRQPDAMLHPSLRPFGVFKPFER